MNRNHAFASLIMVVLVVMAGCTGTRPGVGVPGDAVKADTVGASTEKRTLASYSSWGPTADYRVKPEFVAPGDEIIAPRAGGTDFATPVNESYSQASGTSMATPQVAGAVAILEQVGHQRNIEIDPTGLKTALMAGATPLTFRGVIEPFIESDHPYGNSLNRTYTYTLEGSTMMQVHFYNLSLESGYDYLYVKNEQGETVETITGTHNDYWTQLVRGDTIKLVLESDDSITQFGFVVDKIRNASTTIERPKTTRRVSRFGQGRGLINISNSAQRLNIQQPMVTPGAFVTNQMEQNFTMVLMSDDRAESVSIQSPPWINVNSSALESGLAENAQVEIPVQIDASSVANPVIDTNHPYANSIDNTYIVSRDADRIRIHFSELSVEQGYDYVTIKNGSGGVVATYTGDHDSFWTPWINSSTAAIQLSSDYSINGYGFSVDMVQGAGQTPMSSLPVTGNITVAVGGKQVSTVPVVVRSTDGTGQLTAAFDIETTPGIVGNPVSFDAYGTAGTVNDYIWDFGDGTTAHGEFVSHTYDEPGTYEVTLTVRGQSGQTDTLTRSVTVREGILIGASSPTNNTTAGVTGRLQLTRDHVARNSTVTAKVVIEGIDNGVSAYDVAITSNNTSVATFSSASFTSVSGTPGSTSVSVAPDGSRLSMTSYGANYPDSGTITLATITVATHSSGTAELNLTINQISDESTPVSSPYNVTATPGTSITVAQNGGPPAIVDGIPAPTDTRPNKYLGSPHPPLYEDLDGDGQFTVNDVNTLANAIEQGTPSVMNNAQYYNFDGRSSGTQTLTINDVNTLYNLLLAQ